MPADPKSNDERRVSVRLFSADLANLATVQTHLGLRSESEALRSALHNFAVSIREGQQHRAVGG
jgi:hypothetical protein